MERIDDTKIRLLTQTLEDSGKSPSYALGWCEAMISSMDFELKLTKKQIKALNELLERNIRWASEAK